MDSRHQFAVLLSMMMMMSRCQDLLRSTHGYLMVFLKVDEGPGDTSPDSLSDETTVFSGRCPGLHGNGLPGQKSAKTSTA